jgi:hypothetical protein
MNFYDQQILRRFELHHIYYKKYIFENGYI